MSLTIGQYANEINLLVQIDWENLGTFSNYTDKTVSSFDGRILQAASISKIAKIGDSGISKTCNVTLDDTDGALKTIYDTKIIEGSEAKIYQLITGDASANELIMVGVITSSIIWNEGERTLTLGIESGSVEPKSREIGYAPEEGAWVGMHPDAEGQNWPLVFGSAVKVPAVRVEYSDDYTLGESITIDSTDYLIDGGDTLTQSPTNIELMIGRLLFEGTITDDIFTPTTKNKAIYTDVDLIDPTGPDASNLSVFFTDSFTGNLTGQYVMVDYGTFKFVNYVLRRDIDNPDKWYCAQAFPIMLGLIYTLDEVAPFPRLDWGVDYEQKTAGDNIILSVVGGGWIIPKDAPVYQVTSSGYTDKYVVSLYPASTIGDVWGKRKFYEREIWAKIPSSYYTLTLADATTSPSYTPTTLTFDRALSSRECENWSDEVYVSQTSSLDDTPLEIIEWVVTEFTDYTFNIGSSDTPPFSSNFAYFETTDALQFIEELAWQSASVTFISGANVYLYYLAKAPASVPSARKQTIDMDNVIMKSVELSTKSKEDLSTRFESSYVTDYSEDKEATYITSLNEDLYGVQTSTFDFWAFTCRAGVKAVTDFWVYRRSHSWKEIKVDCIMDVSDVEPFYLGFYDLGADIVDGIYATIHDVSYDTSSPHVTIEAELALQAGDIAEDPNYWVLTGTGCTAPDIGAQADYIVSQDDTCPSYNSYTPLGKEVYKVVFTETPNRVKRGVFFTLKAEIQDSDGNIATITTTEDQTLLTIASVVFRDRFIEKGIAFVAGEWSESFKIIGALGRLSAPLNLKITSTLDSISNGTLNTALKRAK